MRQPDLFERNEDRNDAIGIMVIAGILIVVGTFVLAWYYA